MSNTGIINIHGKEYKTVALRVTEFCKQHKDWGIETDLVSDGEMVVMNQLLSGMRMSTGIGHRLCRRKARCDKYQFHICA